MVKDKTDVPMTCPLIDEVIECIESEDYDKYNVIEMMEQLRRFNSRMRTEINELTDKLKEHGL